jgi:hypothetical protein
MEAKLSPDRTKIAYYKSQDLGGASKYLCINSIYGDAEYCLESPGPALLGFAWHPTGQSLVWTKYSGTRNSSNYSTVMRVHNLADGTTSTIYTKTTPSQEFRIYGWSHDGRYVYGSMYGSNDRKQFDVYTNSFSDFNIIPSLGRQSRDGRYWSYTVLRNPSYRAVVLYDTVTNTETELSTYDVSGKTLMCSDGVFSVSGEYVYYTKHYTGTGYSNIGTSLHAVHIPTMTSTELLDISSDIIVIYE